MEKCAVDLFKLVKEGTPTEVQEAIDAGLDIRAKDRGGLTPLMWASMFNTDPTVITELLDAGADLEAQDDYGFTPLMLAVEFNQNPAVIVTLLKEGADPSVKDRAGRTAFGYAQVRASLLGTQAYQELKDHGTRSSIERR
jgi:ankyrin repeat protein